MASLRQQQSTVKARAADIFAAGVLAVEVTMLNALAFTLILLRDINFSVYGDPPLPIPLYQVLAWVAPILLLAVCLLVAAIAVLVRDDQGPKIRAAFSTGLVAALLANVGAQMFVVYSLVTDGMGPGIALLLGLTLAIVSYVCAKGLLRQMATKTSAI